MWGVVFSVGVCVCDLLIFLHTHRELIREYELVLLRTCLRTNLSNQRQLSLQILPRQRRPSLQVGLNKGQPEAYVHVPIQFFANNIFVWAPSPLGSSHTLLRNVMCFLDPPFLQYIPYNVVNDNIV